MVVMDLFSRRIVGFGVEREHIDGVSVCRMFNHAIAGKPLPKHVSTDHDQLFRFHGWLANLRVLEIDEIKSVSHMPASHPFIERLIGTIRREYLDRVFFWNRVDLMRKLYAFGDYYNALLVHRSLDGITPAQRAGDSSPAPILLTHHAWRQHCGGLFHTPHGGLTANSPPTGKLTRTSVNLQANFFDYRRERRDIRAQLFVVFLRGARRDVKRHGSESLAHVGHGKDAADFFAQHLPDFHRRARTHEEGLCAHGFPARPHVTSSRYIGQARHELYQRDQLAVLYQRHRRC